MVTFKETHRRSTAMKPSGEAAEGRDAIVTELTTVYDKEVQAPAGISFRVR